jgi:outer membrane immunogenic protein
MEFKAPQLLLATVAALALGAMTPTLAADYDTPPADAAHNWDGFYMGIGVAGQGTGIDFADIGKKGDLDIDGRRAGLSGIAGFNYTSGGWLLGVEGSFGSIGFDKTKDITGLGRVKAKSDWLGTMQVRGGYAFDDLLLYGTAGLALQDLEFNSSLGGKFDKTLTGTVVGIGAEYALSDSWAMRAEALAVGFRNDATLNGTKRKFDFADGIVRVGVTHQF